MEHRELFGILGSLESTSEELSWWNAKFTSKNIDAVMTRYPTEQSTLPERLSEMFHFDRRGYIVGKALQKAIMLHLDALDGSAAEEGSVDTVLNSGGVLTGFFCDANREKQWGIWFELNG